MVNLKKKLTPFIFPSKGVNAKKEQKAHDANLNLISARRSLVKTVENVFIIRVANSSKYSMKSLVMLRGVASLF